METNGHPFPHHNSEVADRVTSQSDAECEGSPPKPTGPTYNPFEDEIDSLHLPMSFSPSIFSSTETPEKKENSTFRWSIDHIAILHPAEIDETAHMNVCIDLDSESEKKAQRAIDTFFSRNRIVPSPWNEPTKRHVVFSPKLAPTAYIVGEKPNSSNSATADCATKLSNASTQTLLTVPPDIDLMKCLGEYFSYKHSLEDLESEKVSDDATSGFEKMNSSFSLRRKLFFHGDQDMETSQERASPRCRFSESPAYSTPEKKSPHFHGALLTGQLPCSPLAIDDCISVVQKNRFESSLSPIVGHTTHRNSLSKGKSKMSCSMQRSYLEGLCYATMSPDIHHYQSSPKNAVITEEEEEEYSRQDPQTAMETSVIYTTSSSMSVSAPPFKAKLLIKEISENKDEETCATSRVVTMEDASSGQGDTGYHTERSVSCLSPPCRKFQVDDCNNVIGNDPNSNNRMCMIFSTPTKNNQ